jgi:hypothetical protein
MHTHFLLDRSAGSHGRGPGPLEVEAAEVAGHVDYFADEKETGDVACFHGAGLKIVGVDAAGGDFGFGEALCAGGMEWPMVQAAFAGFEGGVGPAFGCRDLGKMLGEALGQVFAQGFEQGWRIAAAV